jgi:hypothetical protein
MRVLIALLAVLGLLASPATAAASMAACDHALASGAMAGMSTMPGMDASAAKKAGDPCCDPSTRHKQTSKSCAQACAAACGLATALPSAESGAPFAVAPAAHTRARFASLHAYEPAGPERPPRSIA